MTNQHHVIVLDELGASELEYVSDKYDLDAKWILSMVPLRIGPMKMLHDEESKNSGLRNSYDDNDVSYILSNMLAEYKVHKEVDGHNHENVEDDEGIDDNNDKNRDRDL